MLDNVTDWPAPRLACGYDSEAWQRHVRDAGQPATEAQTFDLMGLYDLMGWLPYRANNRDSILRAMHEAGPNPTVLDAGCCAGHYAPPIVAAGGRYVGIGVTPKFVEEARRRNPDLDFRLGDVRKLDFAARQFGVVFCGGVLQHLPEPEAVARELWRVTDKTLLLEANVQNVKPPYMDVSEPPFIDVWYNLFWLDTILQQLGGAIFSISLTPRPQFGFYSALWTIKRQP